MPPSTRKRSISTRSRSTRRRRNIKGGEGELNAFFQKANDTLTNFTSSVSSKMKDFTSTFTVHAQNFAQTIGNGISDIFKAKPSS